MHVISMVINTLKDPGVVSGAKEDEMAGKKSAKKSCGEKVRSS